MWIVSTVSVGKTWQCSALQIAGQADERVSPRKTGEVRCDLCTKVACTNRRKAGPCFSQSEDQFTPCFLPDLGCWSI